MSVGSGGVLGMIAGEGSLPLHGARRARAAGRPLVCVALRDLADPRLAEFAEEILWIHPGEVSRGLAFLRERGVAQAVLAGKVAKNPLFGRADSLGLDDRARRALAGVGDLRDDTLLKQLAQILHAEGISLLPQWSLDPSLRGFEGPLGSVSPTSHQRRDIEFGVPIARWIASRDIGQCIVVQRGTVLAVEALEGTDAALRRGGALAMGAVAIKVARPHQDPRFDLPAIGPGTLASLREAGIAVLAFEAGATLVLEREELARLADAAGVAVVGVCVPADAGVGR